jgi:hypothetical protein
VKRPCGWSNHSCVRDHVSNRATSPQQSVDTVGTGNTAGIVLLTSGKCTCIAACESMRNMLRWVRRRLSCHQLVPDIAGGAHHSALHCGLPGHTPAHAGCLNVRLPCELPQLLRNALRCKGIWDASPRQQAAARRCAQFCTYRMASSPLSSVSPSSPSPISAALAAMSSARPSGSCTACTS